MHQSHQCICHVRKMMWRYVHGAEVAYLYLESKSACVMHKGHWRKHLSKYVIHNTQRSFKHLLTDRYTGKNQSVCLPSLCKSLCRLVNCTTTKLIGWNIVCKTQGKLIRKVSELGVLKNADSYLCSQHLQCRIATTLVWACACHAGCQLHMPVHEDSWKQQCPYKQ